MKKILWLVLFTVPLGNAFGQTWTVSTVQSYTGNTFTYDAITVQNGGILSLTNCTINMNLLGDITIQAGGKLILKNCNVDVSLGAGLNYWKGIMVLGNGLLSQVPANQGQLVLDNSSIQNALIGISVGNRKYTISDQKTSNWHLNGGGIVNGLNSTIRNCRYAMIFNPYYNPSVLQHPIGNKSTFKGCTFIWDGYAQRDLCTSITSDQVYLKSLVELNQVHDIIFSGCSFKSTRTFSNWYLNNNINHDYQFGYDVSGICRGMGLVSFGASFQIQRSAPCTSTLPFNLGLGCTICTGDRCLFEGLAIGVYIDGFENSNMSYPFYPTTNLEPYYEITGAQFTNNRNAIIGYEKSNVVESLVPINDIPTTPLKKIFINRCVFEINDNNYNYHYLFDGDFVCLKNSGEVEISDNSFSIIETVNAVKPNSPGQGLNFNMCWSSDNADVELIDCNQGHISVYRNSFYLSKFQSELCLRKYSFNRFMGLNSDVDVTCNTYVSAPGMDFRNNFPNSCNCELKDWNLYEFTSGVFPFKAQSPSSKDAGNIWNNIPNTVQTNGLVYNIINNLDASSPNVNYNFDNSNPNKEPLVLDDPNSKIFKTAVANVNSCPVSPYCKYVTPRKYYQTASDPGPYASPILPDIAFDFSLPYVGSGSLTIVLTPLQYIPTSGVLTITNSAGEIIFTLPISTDGHSVGISFDFGPYPSGTYYITYTDSSGKKYTVVIVRV